MPHQLCRHIHDTGLSWQPVLESPQFTCQCQCHDACLALAMRRRANIYHPHKAGVFSDPQLVIALLTSFKTPGTDFAPSPSQTTLILQAIPTMSFRARRTTMRPVREFDCVLRARDQQVSTLHEQSTALRAQLETTERRLTNARANAHADARAYQLQERKIEQLRMKLRDIRGVSAGQRRELEDVKRESEALKIQLAEAREESIKHLARISELEEASQEVSQPAPTSNSQSLDFDGVSHDDILDALVQATIGLEALAKVSEEGTSPGHSPDTTSRSTTPFDRAEFGIQTDGNTNANHCRGCHRESQDAEDAERLVSQLRAASERDQGRIRGLEVDMERGRRLIEELRIATEEERRHVRDFKASSVQARSRVMSLEDAARQDRRLIEASETTVEAYRSEIDNLEAQMVLLRSLLDESRTFNDDLEESYDSIIQCKDAFIQDLREKIEDLTASQAWDRHREAAFNDIQEKLEASEVEILELRAELEGAQQNAVVSTNRIIHLEAGASAVRHRLRTTDTENGDLRDELGMTIDRADALEEELLEAQERLDNAESTISQLRQVLDQYGDALTKSPPTRDDIQDAIDADSASDGGSIDTLVMDYDELWQVRSSGDKGVDSRAAFDDGQPLIHSVAPVSVRALELRLEAMTLKYKAAEAARICGDDVEDQLRTELQTLSEGNLCLEAQISATPLLHLDANNPEEELLGLSPIPEEEEEIYVSPSLQRIALPRIQTCPASAAMNVVVQAVARGGSVRGSAIAFANSPLLSSPMLSDIWFSDVMASLAGKGRSVLDWDLPSPGSDSDSS